MSDPTHDEAERLLWRGEVTMETTDTVVGAAERDLTQRAMDPILTVGAR